MTAQQRENSSLLQICSRNGRVRGFLPLRRPAFVCAALRDRPGVAIVQRQLSKAALNRSDFHFA